MIKKIVGFTSLGCMGCFGVLGLFVGLLLLALLIIKLVWAWTVPDLFPGAVEQGLIAESLTWWTAFKLAILVALLGSLAGIRRSS
ncbi:MAG: hypothetical protein FI707_04615 [SAR202 cluster bacterium]|jgi:hypothetical protein|nr:hypothetical protein [Chloroflexota bacterium]MDP6420930.1 hypothetical protein [SAR202 cluster bacterium]MDP6665126.1 hypothetical protein [SAR202 cluster bacterium]MDP6801339.1 hypothetical protein [SAR202 cluster bacterium]MQG57521.1 hypothetical protein [SAR202 cluster bacterium]|tara:strand:+ start:293 stop:547 length:255 start_codon:yes stop_codon:yes gene_type:complete